MNIAFQGRPGAYSQQAIFAYDSAAQTLPFDSFEDILNAVAHGEADTAMLPIENTLGGTVLPALQALIAINLSPVLEFILPIHHVLMAPPATEKINTVLSHPQALAQCQDYLKHRHITAQAFYDTAGAAEYLAKERLPNTAAIASKIAAEYYGLTILDENIEDKSFNQTRFLLIARQPQKYEATRVYKTTLTFTLPNQYNALASVLSVFGQHKINLSKIESHPTREGVWEYLFFVDVIGHVEHQPLQRALEQIRPQVTSLRCLDSYCIVDKQEKTFE